MTVSVEEITADVVVSLSTNRRKWSVAAFGSTYIGSTSDRPFRITGGKWMYSGVKEPFYGPDWGGPRTDPSDPSTGTTGAITATNSGTGVMTGNIAVREVFYRELTNERSLPGWGAATLDCGTDGCTVTVTSNAVADLTDYFVSHREFYVNYIDQVGVYYLAARIPYTADSDTVDINVTADALMTGPGNRPMETQRENAIFPAVRTACLYKGRIFGAVLEPREFISGTTVTLTNGVEFATILTSGGETWWESDLYKGIVNRDTNEIVAYIDRVMDGTNARIRIPQDLREQSFWDKDTVTLDNVGLAGDESMIYCSPIYAGEAGGGITYGMLSWNALDQLRDQGFYSTGARISKLLTSGDNLIVIYDRGIAFYQGTENVGAPVQIQQFVVAENVGAYNPDAVWKTPDGSVYFQGGNRIFAIKNGQVVDLTVTQGNVSFWNKYVEPNAYGQMLFQTAYNSERNAALMVNVPKKGEGTGELGTWGIQLNHDSNTLHPMRWPVKFNAVDSLLHDTGTWQWYGGTKDGQIYKIAVKDKVGDDYKAADSDTLVENQPVTWTWTGGVSWVNGNVYPVGFRVLVDSDATSGISATVEADVKGGNINSQTFTADSSVPLTHELINRLEWASFQRCSGYGVQYRVRGSTSEQFTLVQLAVKEDLLPARGFE